MTNKQIVAEKIKRNSSVVKEVNRTEFRIRCPICGDSKKDPLDTHCYIKNTLDPMDPLQYYCFLCNSHGRIGKTFLKKLGVDSQTIAMIEKQVVNRIPSLFTSDINIVTGTPVMDSPQVAYIENRLGPGFTYEDYDRFKIIWDMKYISEYVNKKTRNILPNLSNTISFISDDKTLILTRTFLSSEHSHQWRKIRIVETNTRSFYTIKSTLDLFTSDKIVVNISEGILDLISIYKHFNEGPNSVYIAALGSDYIPALEYMMAKGFVGSNIEIRVYIDDGIDERELFSRLKTMKWVFGSIHVFKNTLYKDVGVKLDQIKLIHKCV